MEEKSVSENLDPDIKISGKGQTKLVKKRISFRAYEELHENHPPTSFVETMMHLFKGNVGTGCYAMSNAVMNGGIIVGPLLLIVIAFICVHVQHILINCADHVKTLHKLDTRPDYAETVELSFLSSKTETFQRWGPRLKKTCNIFICVTQLGFCSVYFLFIGRNIEQVLEFYGHKVEIHWIVCIALVPIWLTALIRKLKYIAIFSAIANFCMIVGIFLTISYAGRNLPPLSERNYFASWETLPLYFGIALFAFEGIALVLPLQNAMKKPESFSQTFGVLNVGMFFVTIIYLVIGVIGYWKYGELTQGSLTLNLPTHEKLAQVTMLMIACGVMFGYAIQFFVANQIIYSYILEKSKFSNQHPVCADLVLRSLLVLVTFTVAEVVPNLSLLLSLIGSVCCVVLAFVLPVLAELIILHEKTTGIGAWIWIKNVIILFIALLGFIFGGGSSLKKIIEELIA